MTDQRAANVNPIRNGTRLRVAVGNLPAKLRPLGRQARMYRAQLEHECLARHGDIDPLAAHEIGLATEATLHQSVCRWLLRERLGSMTASDILNCSLSIVKAGEVRNRAIRALRLAPPTTEELREQYQRQVLEAYSQPPAAPVATSPAEPSQQATQPPDATAGHRCDSAGCETGQTVCGAEAGQEPNSWDTSIPEVEGDNEQ